MSELISNGQETPAGNGKGFAWTTSFYTSDIGEVYRIKRHSDLVRSAKDREEDVWLRAAVTKSIVATTTESPEEVLRSVRISRLEERLRLVETRLERAEREVHLWKRALLNILQLFLPSQFIAALDGRQGNAIDDQPLSVVKRKYFPQEVMPGGLRQPGEGMAGPPRQEELTIRPEEVLQALNAKKGKSLKLVTSCILAAAICLFSLVACILSLVDIWDVGDPLLWSVVISGSFGVAGSNYLYLRRLWT